MSNRAKNVALFGSTGSIGTSALQVIAASRGELRAVALSAHGNTELALQQSITHRPRWLIITDPASAARQDWSRLPSGTELLVGPDQLEAVIEQGRKSSAVPNALRGVLKPDSVGNALRGVPGAKAGPERHEGTFPTDQKQSNADIIDTDSIDTVLAAIVGSAGLRSTWAAVAAGLNVALANKEALVMAGQLIMQKASASGATILPVDSEHSAIFQCLLSGGRDEVRRVILTASGGPFRRHTAQQLRHVTVDEALRHPNWQMGPKITIDSATMMNKALEIIEARWLFDLRADQIDVVVHPQSVVHSLVEWVDGAVIAQLSPPDMKLPIQYALYYPQRCPGIAKRLDFSQSMQLEFEPPDFERFGALQLGLEAARAGGTVGAVLNAANEAAVGQFLAGELAFSEIVPVCRRIIENHHYEPNPSLERLLELDRWARQEILRWVCT